MILFSGISPNFNQLLREELFGCFKYIHIPYSELMNMPTKDRKFYIQRHNEVTAAENRKNNGNTMEVTGESMNNIGDSVLKRGF
jgi:hypothetical protein